MREIRLELSPQAKARMAAAQQAACFKCSCKGKCKGNVPEGGCSGPVTVLDIVGAVRSAAGSALRAVALSWQGMTAVALFAFAYLSTVN